MKPEFVVSPESSGHVFGTMLHCSRSNQPNSFQEACVTSVQKALSCSPSGSRDKRWTAQAKSHKDVPKVSADQPAFAFQSHEKRSIAWTEQPSLSLLPQGSHEALHEMMHSLLVALADRQQQLSRHVEPRPPHGHITASTLVAMEKQVRVIRDS